MSTTAGPSGLSSSGLPDSTQLQRGKAAKLAAHSHAATMGRRCPAPGVSPARGVAHMYSRGVTTRAAAASGPGLAKSAWSASSTLALQDTPQHKPRTSVIAAASRRSSSRSRATKNDSNSSSSSSSGKGFGSISTSSSKKGTNSRRSKGRSTSSNEPEPDKDATIAQHQDSEQHGAGPITSSSSSSRDEAAAPAAAAAAEPKPSDLLHTAGHVEIPPGPAALSSAEHAVEAAAAAAEAAAPAGGGSSPGSVTTSRDVDTPGLDVPDSPPWSPDGPDNTQPDQPDQPISGFMGRDRSDEPTTAGQPADLDNLPHLQPGHQERHDLAAAAADDVSAAAARMGSSATDATPTAAAVAASPRQLEAQAASSSAADELLQHVKSQTGNFRDITGMDSKEYIQALNEPHFPSLEVSERVRKSDPAPSSSSSSSGGTNDQPDANVTGDSSSSSSSNSSNADDRFSRWEQQRPRDTYDEFLDSERLMSATAGAAAAGPAVNPAPAAGGLTGKELRLGPDGIDQDRYQALEAAAGETAVTAAVGAGPSSSSNRRRRKGSKDSNGSSSSSSGQSDDASVARYMAFAGSGEQSGPQQQQGDDALADAPATAYDLSESERMMSTSGGTAASGLQGPAPAAGGLTDEEIRLGPDGVDQDRYQALEQAAGETDQANGSDSHSSSSEPSPLEAALSPNAPSAGAVALDSSSSSMSPSKAVKTTLSGTDASVSSTTAEQLGTLGGDLGGSAAAAGGGAADVADSSDAKPQPAAAVAGTAAAKSGSSDMEGAAAESAAIAAVEAGNSQGTNDRSTDEQQQREASDQENSLVNASATAYDLSESERMMSTSGGAAAAGPAVNPAPASGGLTDEEIRLGPEGMDQDRYQALEAAAGEIADASSSTSAEGEIGQQAHASGIPGAAAADVAAANTGEIIDISGHGYPREASSAEDAAARSQEQQQQQQQSDTSDSTLTDAPTTAYDMSESERMMSTSGGAAASGLQGSAPAAGGLTDEEIRLGPDSIDQDRYQAREEAAGETADASGNDSTSSTSSSAEGEIGQQAHASGIPGAAAADVAAAKTGELTDISGQGYPREAQSAEGNPQEQQQDTVSDSALTDAPATAYDLSESERMMSTSGGTAASGLQGPAPAAAGLTDEEIRLGPDRLDQDRYQALEQAAGEVAAAAKHSSSSRHVNLSSIDYSDLAGDSSVDLAEDLAAHGFSAVKRSLDRNSPAASSDYQPDYQAFGGQVPKQYKPDRATAAAEGGAQPDAESSTYKPDYQAFGGQVPNQYKLGQAAADGGAQPDTEASSYKPDYQAFGGQVPDQYKTSQATAAGGSPDSQASSDQAGIRKDTSSNTPHTSFAADALARAKESLHKAVQKVRTGSGSSVDIGTAPARPGSTAAAPKGAPVRPSSPESSAHYGSFAAQRLATAAENLSKNGYTAARKSPEPGDTSSSRTDEASSDSSSDSIVRGNSAGQSMTAAVQNLASSSAETAQRLGQSSADVAQQLASASSAAAQQLADISTAAGQQLGQGSAAAVDKVPSGLKIGSEKGAGVMKRAARVAYRWNTEADKALLKLLRGLSTVLRVSGMYLLTGAMRAAAAVLRILRITTDKLLLQPSKAAVHMLGNTLHLTARKTRAQLPAVKAAAADAATSAATAAADAAAAATSATATGISVAGSALGSSAAAAGSAVAAAAGAAAQTVVSATAGLTGSNASRDSSSTSNMAGKLLCIQSDTAEGRTMHMAFDTRYTVTTTTSSSSSRPQQKGRDSPHDLTAAVAKPFPATPEVGVSSPGPLRGLQAVAAEAANSLGLAQAQAVDAAATGVRTLGAMGQQAVGSVLGGSGSSSSGSGSGGYVADSAAPADVRSPPGAPQQQQQQQKGLLARARGGVLKDIGRMTRPPKSSSSSSTTDRYAAISILGASWEEPDPVGYSIDEPHAAAAAPAGAGGNGSSSVVQQSTAPHAAAAPTTSSHASTAAGTASAPVTAATTTTSRMAQSPGVAATVTPDTMQGSAVTTDLAVAAADDEVMQLLHQLHDLLQTCMQLKEKIQQDTKALNELVQQLSALEASAGDPTTAAASSDSDQQQLIDQITDLDSSMANGLQQLKDLEAATAHIQAELATADAAAMEAAAADSGDATAIPPLYGAAIGYSRSNGGGGSSSSGTTAAGLGGGGGSSRSGGPKSGAAARNPQPSQVPGVGRAEKLQLPIGFGSLSRQEQQQLLQLYAAGGAGGPGGGRGGGGPGGGRGPRGSGDRGHNPDHGGHRRRGFMYWVKAVLSSLGHMQASDAIQLVVQLWLGVVMLSGVAWYAYQLLYKMPVQEVKQMATTAVHAAETGADIAHGAVHAAATVAHAVGSAAGVETSLPSPDDIIPSRHSGDSKGIGHKIKGLGKKLKPAGKHLGQGLKGLGTAGHSAISAVVSPVKAVITGSKGAKVSSSKPDSQAVMAVATRLGAGLLLLVAAGAWGAEEAGKGGHRRRGFSSRGVRGFSGSSKQQGGSGQGSAAVSLVRSVVGGALAVPVAVLGRGHNGSSSGSRKGSRMKDRTKSVVMNFDDGTVYGDQLVIPGDKVLANGKKIPAAGGSKALMSGRSALLANPPASDSGAADSHEYIQLYRTLMDRQGSWR